jgi:hypothetical protein
MSPFDEMPVDFITPALGAIVGFALAQFVNIARLIWTASRSAKLKIDDLGTDCMLFSHTLKDGSVELIYAFGVENVGKRSAAGVRFQLLKTELQTRKGSGDFDPPSHSALDLSLSHSEEGGEKTKQVTLVPGARAFVRLAVWREASGIITPSSAAPFDYYQKVAEYAYEYRFTVAAFDETGRFATKSFTLMPPKARRPTCKGDRST